MKCFYWLFLCIGTNLSAQDTTCVDLLQQSAIKLPQAVFEKCNTGQGQIKSTATYKIKGSDADSVEAYLVRHYKMSKLKFTCCGWESEQSGSYPSGDHYLEISMYANAEKMDSTGKLYIEKDRKKIMYFYVVVTSYGEI